MPSKDEGTEIPPNPPSPVLSNAERKAEVAAEAVDTTAPDAPKSDG
jgi:hypothetical protein